MLTNPGFSFVGISGQHKIVPTEQTDLEIWGPIYSQSIICHYDDKLVDVYKTGPGFNYTDSSVVMEFASIDLNDNDSIISFCDKYGMPCSMRQEANLTNDYLFFNATKDEFSKSIPFGRPKEVIWLGLVKKEIANIKLTIELNQAIEINDLIKIVHIITFFCLDLSVLDFNGTNRKTESLKFNHGFYRTAVDEGFDYKNGLDNIDYSYFLEEFLANIESDFAICESYHAHGQDYPNAYPQIYHSLWQHYHSLFSYLLTITTIESVSPYGEVIFNPALEDIDLTELKRESKKTITIAKALLSDIFKEKLHRIYPEIIFNSSNAPESSWRIPSLEDAMYLELFFRLTPSTTVKKCANPTCPGYFQWSSSRPTKIYCSPQCASLMAKRMERQRKK